MIIYKVISPSNKVYIGMSSQPFELRKKQHFYDAANINCKRRFMRAIRKYGQSLIWEIIESNLTKDEAIFLECYYINFYDSYKNGYNGTIGGDSGPGFIKKTPKVCKDISNRLKKQWKDPKFRGTAGAGLKKFKESDAGKLLNLKPVIVSKDNQEFYFNSRKEAAKYINGSLQEVCRAVKNPNRTPRGYKVREAV